MGKKRNILNMPLMQAMCHSCPFGPNGDPVIRAMVEARVLSEASQTCHSTGSVNGKPDTHLCRGARDFQLTIFHRMGFLPEPTDAAWAEKWEEVQSDL